MREHSMMLNALNKPSNIFFLYNFMNITLLVDFAGVDLFVYVMHSFYLRDA